MASNRNRLFGELLTQGVQKIKIVEDKQIQLIQDELAHVVNKAGSKTIDYWRRGYVPDAKTIDSLARIITKRGQMDASWLAAFLDSASSNQTNVLLKELFPDEKELKYVPGRLPHIGFTEFVGRDTLANSILSFLANTTGDSLVTIDGQGGIGKTALARYLAHKCVNTNVFDEGVWCSAPQHQILHSMHTEEITFEHIVNVVGVRSNGVVFSSFSLEEKLKRFEQILKASKHLLILDNLDTASEPQETIAEKLLPYLGYSKAIFTSRHRFNLSSAYTVNLSGMSVEDSVDFLRYVAAHKGRAASHVQEASEQELKEIAFATGGSPLAMQLIVGQLVQFSLSVALEYLKDATPLGSVRAGEEYMKFYRRIFLRSWQIMSEAAKNTLVALVPFNTSDGCSIEALEGITDAPSHALVKSVDELWYLSLLEINRGAVLNDLRYYLHPLTQYFVQNDIVRYVQNG